MPDPPPPIPPEERATAQKALRALGRLVPVVEEMYERDWGTGWRSRLTTELNDRDAAHFHDERRLLKAIARTAPPLRLFPRHVPDDIYALVPLANDVMHNDGSRWEGDTLARFQGAIASLLQAAVPPTDHVCAAVPGGQIEVWRLREGGVVEHRWWLEADGWSPWHTFDAPPAQALTAVSFGPGHIEVFVLDTGNEVQHRWWLMDERHPSGHWFRWHPFSAGVRVLGPLSAASRERGHIELVARSLEGDLVHAWRHPTGAWSRWHSLGDSP